MVTAVALVGSISMVSWNKMYPGNKTEYTWHSLFLALTNSELSSRCCRMDVLFWSSGENNFVFQADKDILVEYILEDIMNQNLEHGWDIGETKGHEKIFIVACGVGVFGSCLPLITFSDTD